jgi:glycosyltransferase involved in cell wall biosynthesis
MTGKLTILHTEASKGWGGQEIRILDESAGLRARGHDVHIAAPAESPIFAAAARWNVPAQAIALDRRRPSSLAALVRLIRDIKPDVIITHSSSDSWLVAAATRFSAVRAAVVRTRHLSTPVASGILNRWLYGRVPACVVTTGEAIRSHLVEQLGLRPEAVFSIPTGANISRFHPGDRAAARARLGLSAEGALIGIVATLRSWKGHRFLISAMQDPRLAAARLVIVGDGPQDSALRELVAATGLDSRVLFAGQQQDVAPWMQALDVFALPSTGNEGVPQALIQAMACGLPVVTTPVGAIRELVKDQETGLLVPPEDVNALASALSRLLREGEFAAKLGSAGREYVLRHFTSEIMLDRMETILRDAAVSRTPPGG